MQVVLKSMVVFVYSDSVTSVKQKHIKTISSFKVTWLDQQPTKRTQRFIIMVSLFVSQLTRVEKQKRQIVQK